MAHLMIVDDEAIVALMLEDYAPDLGFDQTTLATTEQQALAALEQITPDVAIVDIELQGRRTFRVADRLDDLGVPFAFATGYSVHDVPARHRHVPILEKPYSLDTVRCALANLRQPATATSAPAKDEPVG